MKKLLKLLLVILNESRLRRESEEPPCTNTGVCTGRFFATLRMTVVLLCIGVILLIPLLGGVRGGFSLAQNPGDGLFNFNQVYRVEFTFSQSNWWDSLKTYHENYSNGGNIQYLMGDVKINSVTINNVGIRLKGLSSYYSVIDSSNKVSFKIDFNNYVSGQNFDGLRKINLNNGYNDPTFMREKISLDFLNKQGIFAPRCTYAEVYINGAYWGFYTLVEQIDRTFLNSKFGDNNGNLYKAPHGGADLSLNSDPYSDYVLKTNELVNNRSDLINLIDIINNTTEVQFMDELESVLYTNSYMGLWAANNLFVDFDGYEYAANNYYIYNNSFDNKFYWIAWDRNGSFGGGWWNMSVAEKENLSVYYYYTPNPPLPPLIAPPTLHERMLQNTNYTDEYLNTLCAYLQGDFRIKYLYDQIDTLYNRIKPYVYADVNKLYTNQDFENNIDFAVSIDSIKELPGLKPFIAARIAKVANEIGCLVGIDEFQVTDFRFQVYPNPFNTSTTIYIKSEIRTPAKGGSALGGKSEINFMLYDLLGREIKHITIIGNKTEIHRDNLPAGLYIYKLVLSDSEGSDRNSILATGKIIIQ